MRVSERRTVVVTGIGVVSAAGLGLAALAAALRADRGCATAVDGALPVRAVASAPDVPVLADFPDDRKAWLAAAALEEALADAGAPSGERTAVFLGTGLSSITPRELAEDVYPHLRAGAFDRAAIRGRIGWRRAGTCPTG